MWCLLILAFTSRICQRLLPKIVYVELQRQDSLPVLSVVFEREDEVHDGALGTAA